MTDDTQKSERFIACRPFKKWEVWDTQNKDQSLRLCVCFERAAAELIAAALNEQARSGENA